jgi:CHAT domain-containing protein
LEKEYAELIKHYEEEFPEYYSFKYSDKVISIEEVQSSLPADQSLVEYSIKEPEDGDDGEIITFVISKDSCSVNRIKIDSTFSKDIEHVITLLKEVIPGHTTLKKFANYSSSAYNLYNILIAPVKEHIKNTRVMFIPEGKLAYLPFDAFLTELPDTSKLRFWNLKYLVYDYAVSYSYSATLQFHYFSNSSVADKDFIAFAPKYKEIEIDMEKLLERDELLFPLPGAKWEVEEISNMIKGDVYIGEKSGEEVFKKSAGKYDIIHLAMHTVINDSLPMYSNLVFSNDSINRDNGRLNTHEIYNMEFNARLTVLSACNTGSGRLRKGEGVMSLARAFMYSGCPSIVMTLWSVSDNSSSEIMINFYRELIKGKSKDIALRDAKLRHIKNITSPLKANPFFWLGFVTIGDQSALYKNEKTVLGRYLILIGIIVVLIILSERLITNRKKRKRIRS